MQDVLTRFKAKHSDFSELPSKACFQMNDTHPTIAVAELMRLLIDQEGLDWDKAWGIVTKVCISFACCFVSCLALTAAVMKAKVLGSGMIWGCKLQLCTWAREACSRSSQPFHTVS